MARIGYVRCSTSEQNHARQEEILKEAGCDKVFTERNKPFVSENVEMRVKMTRILQQ